MRYTMRERRQELPVGEPQPTLQGGRYGMQLMCCDGGLGTATIIERLDNRGRKHHFAAGGVELRVPLFALDGGEAEEALAALAFQLRHLLQAAAVPFLP